MKQLARPILSSRTLKGLLAITSVVFLLNALPFLEIPFILIQFFVATFTDSVTGWDANSNFSDFTQVTSRAAVVGSAVAVLIAVLVAACVGVLVYQKRARAIKYVNSKVERIRNSKIKTLLLVLILAALITLWIMSKGWADLWLF